MTAFASVQSSADMAPVPGWLVVVALFAVAIPVAVFLVGRFIAGNRTVDRAPKPGVPYLPLERALRDHPASYPNVRRIDSVKRISDCDEGACSVMRQARQEGRMKP